VDGGEEREEHTSRKSRWTRMPRPASSQSITGSAYSFMDAVNITRVYHPETCDENEQQETGRRRWGTDGAKKKVDKWTLVDMILGMSAGKDDVDCVSWRGDGGGWEERSSGRNWAGCRVDESLVKIEYQSFQSEMAPASRVERHRAG